MVSMSTVAVPMARTPQRRWSDERLARRAGEGDEHAFAVLYERYHQQLFRYCRSILRDDVEAQDALQSTFERAFAALRERRRRAPLRPWLFRIAHNEAITHIRRRTATQGHEPEPAAHAASAEQVAAQRARLATLVEDLNGLAERLRGALVMRELADLSHEEIGLALSISPAAAKQAIFEARRALQECEEGRAMSCEDIRRRISDGDGRALRGRRIRAHLGSCAGCAAFAAAIPARQAQLRAIAPTLPAAAATAILARAVGAAPGHGASAASMGAGPAGGSVLGKGAVTALGSKLAVGAAVLATAAAGAGGVVVVTRLVHHPAPARAGASGVARADRRPAARTAHRTDTGAVPARSIVAGASHRHLVTDRSRRELRQAHAVTLAAVRRALRRQLLEARSRATATHTTIRWRRDGGGATGPPTRRYHVGAGSGPGLQGPPQIGKPISS